MKNPSQLITFFALIIGPIAGQTDTSCYNFHVPETADRAASILAFKTETWCYQDLSYPAGSTFIFNGDEETVRPELAMVVDANGILTHGSLLAGEVTVHRVRASEFNPFSIPLKEPQNIWPQEANQIYDPHSADSVLEFLLAARSPVNDLSIHAIPEDHASANIKPWRGYWWPYRGRTLYGSEKSPLAKYDRYVDANTGSNPNAASWEGKHHRFHGVLWEGHCNGWAASSILRKQPDKPKHDPRSGVTFSVSDQKGLLAETDYCAKTAFFGKRYRGRTGDDINDIHPEVFHKTLLYYIGELRKPVVMDYKRKASVDNNVISGYSMSRLKKSDYEYDITAVLTMHKYDRSRSEELGIARTYTRTYKYSLMTDTTGKIVKGSWNSENPDFLWVPLGISDCSTNNPQLKHEIVQQILDL